MSILDLFRRPDINEGLHRFENTPGAVLLDVRTAEEYAAGHLPGSRNLPLHLLDTPGIPLPDVNAPVFVYCRSGARSGQAVAALKRMGYDHVTNIGGIQTYRGKTKGGTTA